MLPKDPVMLLSVINTRLRDFHHSFNDFCLTHNYDKEEIITKLESIDYHYDKESNQFK